MLGLAAISSDDEAEAAEIAAEAAGAADEDEEAAAAGVKTEEAGGAAATGAAAAGGGADPMAGLVRRTARAGKSRLMMVDGHQVFGLNLKHPPLPVFLPSPSLPAVLPRCSHARAGGLVLYVKGGVGGWACGYKACSCRGGVAPPHDGGRPPGGACGGGWIIPHPPRAQASHSCVRAHVGLGLSLVGWVGGGKEDVEMVGGVGRGGSVCVSLVDGPQVLLNRPPPEGGLEVCKQQLGQSRVLVQGGHESNSYTAHDQSQHH